MSDQDDEGDDVDVAWKIPQPTGPIPVAGWICARCRRIWSGNRTVCGCEEEDLTRSGSNRGN